MKKIARFWLLLAYVSATWGTMDLAYGRSASGLSMALAGLSFLYLSHRSTDPNFFG